MIKIFYGTDRVRARKLAEGLLGADFEVIESENLASNDMASVFYGTSLFGSDRKILVKDLSENKECWELFAQYVDTPHFVVLLESKIDKRSAVYKELSKNKAVEFKEVNLPEVLDRFASFEPFDVAFSGNAKLALSKLKDLELNGGEPYSLIGLMATQAIKKINTRDNAKAIRAIKILAKTDLDMKSSMIEPWELVRIALVKIAAL